MSDRRVVATTWRSTDHGRTYEPCEILAGSLASTWRLATRMVDGWGNIYWDNPPEDRRRPAPPAPPAPPARAAEPDRLPPYQPDGMETDLLLLDGDSLNGSCSHCQRNVDNHDEAHRVSSILRGGKGVECAIRGDIDWYLARPLGAYRPKGQP